jgi:hypothetical protein
MMTQSQASALEAATHGITADKLMPYRCYAIAETGHILGLRKVMCANEEQARRLAATAFRDDPRCCVIEVWEVGRRIARLNAAA